ncbi:RNA-directed DNA polymerase, eukaryota, reverse transcriptase zinc-binding domain protein [Tanacetum coccineum]
MGNYITKEDDVAKISTSIFVTNFLDSFSAKDLFQSCKQYGHVVGTFIPNKRSKAGKRFGFVRFINVFNDESKDNGFMAVSNSFVQAVKGGSMFGNTECDSIPAIVLDDECLYSKDVANSLMGRVKDFFSLSNLKIALTNEGFDDINIRYMGELWYDFTVEGRNAWVEIEGVLFKFWTEKTFKRIANKWGELLDVDDQEESCFHSRRLCIYTKSHSNIFDSFKIAFRGKVYWIRAKEVPGWIPEIMKVSDDDEQSVEEVKGGDIVMHEVGNHGEDSDVDAVPETVFDESSGQKKKQSEDTFGIYPLLDKQRKVNSHDDTMNGESLKYPPGFTPIDATEMMGQSNENVKKQNGDRDQTNNVEEPLNGRDDCSDNMGNQHNDLDSGCSGRFKKSVAPRTGGSILCLMEEVVKVGQTMGYNMEGCVKDIMNIIESRGASSETKMESMELITIKSCWGNYAFDYVHSDVVVWVKTGANLLIVVVYAPHDLKDKCMLWDYLTHVSNHWDGEVMMMGDFNEVRFKSDRFGSFFNERGADMFNSFISNASLEEVPLGGCAYTWCHKSASKMTVDGDLDKGNGSDEVVSKQNGEYINSMHRLNKIKDFEATQMLRLIGL